MSSMSYSRKLTGGERELAWSIFGDSIDLDNVELRHRKWWPLQPRNVVMAPCGHIHFHPCRDLWREDFSAANLIMRRLFVHELCHIWQTQSGLFLPLWRMPFARYSYKLTPGKALHKYGIEQQAEIVADSYLIREGARSVTIEDRQRYEDLIAQLKLQKAV